MHFHVSSMDYLDQLCFNSICVTADDDTLLMTSAWRSSVAVLAVSLSSGKLERLSTHDTDRSSWGLGATCQGMLSDKTTSHAVQITSHPHCRDFNQKKQTLSQNNKVCM